MFLLKPMLSKLDVKKIKVSLEPLIFMYNNAEEYECKDFELDAFKKQQKLSLTHFYVKGMYQRPVVLLIRNTLDSNGGKLSKQRLLTDGQAAQPYLTEEPETGFNPQEIFLTTEGMIHTSNTNTHLFKKRKIHSLLKEVHEIQVLSFKHPGSQRQSPKRFHHPNQQNDTATQFELELPRSQSSVEISLD